jgi:hypothetical protein
MEDIQPKLWFSGPFVPLSGSEIWKEMLLQMTTVSLQPVPSLHIIPCEQQVLIELAINSSDFWCLLCHVPTRKPFY